MPDFTIIDARPWHCGAMVRLLRIEHQKAIARLGINSHRELRERFDASAFRRAWLIDGRLAALGGVTGPQAAAVGQIWLALSNEAMRYPLAIVKEARCQITEIMSVKRVIATTILDGDETSKRFAIFLGFVPSDAEAEAPAVSRYGRRELYRRLDTSHAARVPVGIGYAVAMTYLEAA